jgi:hypothetical protein
MLMIYIYWITYDPSCILILVYDAEMRFATNSTEIAIAEAKQDMY